MIEIVFRNSQKAFGLFEKLIKLQSTYHLSIGVAFELAAAIYILLYLAWETG